MIKVAVLDDYQNIFKEFVDIEKYKINILLKFLTNHFKMKMKQF